MDPLRFHPILKNALWGGRRLGSELNKTIGDAKDVSESWEVADLPGDESVVAKGSFEGTTLRELMLSHRDELLGVHSLRDRFPLLVKFLDANKDLSVQVHPGKKNFEAFLGLCSSKAEMWVVLDSQPGSRIYIGLKEGVDRSCFENAIADGTVLDCLHCVEVKQGDCFYLKPGTVHSLGAGILVAEIQEPNNITYRIDDWGRVDALGNQRELHLELGLDAIDFSIGPVDPLTPQGIAKSENSKELVNNDYFVVHQHRGPATFDFPNDNRAHVLTLLQGNVNSNDPSFGILRKGETIVLPAQRASLELETNREALLLDSFLN